MLGYDIEIKSAAPMAPNSSTAILRSDGKVIARVLISKGREHPVASCDCQDDRPCIHILALKSMYGLEDLTSR
jgi:hypothetical protein